MGNSESVGKNTLESLQNNLTKSVFKAQKELHDANMEHLCKFFTITYKDEVEALENMILVPKTVRIKVNDEDMIDVPLCSLVSMNYMDIKDVTIKTQVEVKSIGKHITLCPKHKNTHPMIDLDIAMTTTPLAENVHRIIHKFNL